MVYLPRLQEEQRKDPLSPYNLINIRMTLGQPKVHSHDGTPDYLIHSDLEALTKDFVEKNNLGQPRVLHAKKNKVINLIWDDDHLIFTYERGPEQTNHQFGSPTPPGAFFFEEVYSAEGIIQKKPVLLEATVNKSGTMIGMDNMRSRREDTHPYWFIRDAKA